MGERVLTVLEEVENLTVYGVDPAVIERIEEKYKKEKEASYNYHAKIENWLREKVSKQDAVIKALLEYVQFERQ